MLKIEKAGYTAHIVVLINKFESAKLDFPPYQIACR